MNTTQDHTLDDLEARLTATLQRRAAALPVADRPFDPNEVTLAPTAPAAPILLADRRRRIALVAGLAAAAALTIGVIAVNRSDNTEDQAPPVGSPNTTVAGQDASVPAAPDAAPPAVEVEQAFPSVVPGVLPDAPQALPTWLPDGYEIFHLTRRPESYTTQDAAWQVWERADGARVTFNLDSVGLTDEVPAITTTGMLVIRQEFPEEAFGSGFVATGGTDAEPIRLDGTWTGLSRDQALAFLGTLTPVSTDIHEGVVSSDPAWTMTDGHAGTGETYPLGVVEEMLFGTGFDNGSITGQVSLDVTTTPRDIPRIDGNRGAVGRRNPSLADERAVLGARRAGVPPGRRAS